MGVIETLILTTTLAGVVGTGLGAQKGILIKGGEYLETAHKLTSVPCSRRTPTAQSVCC